MLPNLVDFQGPINSCETPYPSKWNFKFASTRLPIRWLALDVRIQVIGC